MKLDIYQIDAFTSEPFHGNPAAVVPLEGWLPEATMLDIAAENNLAETAFFVPSGDGFEIKWFTPTAEIDLCGHATVASAYVLYNELGFGGSQINFQSKSGELRVSRDGERFVLDFPSRPPVECEMPAGLVEALGVEPTRVLKSRDYMAVYETEAEILALKPDLRAIGELDVHAVIVTAPGERSDFVSRFFAPAVGVDEDPVTGSAHCTLTPYWVERLGKNSLFARKLSKRGGEVYCEMAGDRVHLGGDAVLYLKGEIYVEAGQSDAAAG